MNPGDCAIDHFLCFHRRSKSSSQPFATGILFDTTKTMIDDRDKVAILAVSVRSLSV
jgi:hypothetical protein